MYELFITVVNLVEKLGYLGLLIMTAVEGTFVPIPNEITLIPAGFLIAKGQFNLFIVLFVSIVGSLSGSIINYFIAFYCGRKLVKNYGRYIMLSEKKLEYIEKFFNKHGHFSVFIGRILPGLKHFISFPAGLGKMNFTTFVIYSGLGGTMWIFILLILGYSIGHSEALISYYVEKLNWLTLVFAVIAVILYLARVGLIKKR